MTTTLRERPASAVRVPTRTATPSLAAVPRAVLGLQRLAGNAATTVAIQRACCSSCSTGGTCDSKRPPEERDRGAVVQRSVWEEESPGDEPDRGSGGPGSDWSSGGTAQDGPASGADADRFPHLEAIVIGIMDANFASLVAQAKVVAVKKGKKLDGKTCAQLVIEERVDCDNDTETMSKVIEYGIGVVGAVIGNLISPGAGTLPGYTIGKEIGDMVATYVKTHWQTECAQAEASNQQHCNADQRPPDSQPAPGPASQPSERTPSPGGLPPHVLVPDEPGPGVGRCDEPPIPGQTICVSPGGGFCSQTVDGQILDCTLPPAPDVPRETGCQAQCNQGPIPQPMIRRGSNSPSVGELQEKLNSVIVAGQPLVVDCDFGPATDSSVRQFQANEGLGADGIVGPKTWGRLDALATRPVCTT